MKTIRKQTLCFVVIVFAGGAYFNLLCAAEEKNAISAQQAWQLLKEGNARFAADRSEHKDLSQKRRLELVKGQHPIAVVLACADSRVAPELIFNQGLGDVFVLRVAGNIAEPFVLGSVEYAVEHLHTPLVVVLGHEKCGAVVAALDAEMPGGNLRTVINNVYIGKHLPIEPDAALSAAITNNVLHQTELITDRSYSLKKAVDEKKLKIVSGVYHLDSGKVEWLGESQE
ncbi:MAG: carbonic anhydrase [Thermoguttaceae bacterium]|jgi:carbonic anhydrase